MNEFLDSFISFAVETAEETAKEEGRNAIKDFLTSKEFIGVTSLVTSAVISNELDSAICKRMDEDNMPEKMDEKERKGYNLKKRLITASENGATKVLTKTAIKSIVGLFA